MFVFQAEDGIRDLVRSRGLGDVYKRQSQGWFDRCWDATKNAAATNVVSGMIKEVDAELAKIPRRTIINL